MVIIVYNLIKKFVNEFVRLIIEDYMTPEISMPSNQHERQTMTEDGR